MAIPTSAGILLYRFRDGRLEVLLGHPGGPFFGRKDFGSWSIPKGQRGPEDADLEATARREFQEETGHRVPAGPLLDLGSVRQRGGKVVYAWAAEGDLDPAEATSNMIEFLWPPFTGRVKRFPEIDRVGWFGPEEARERMKEAQIPFIERLQTALGPSGQPRAPQGGPAVRLPTSDGRRGLAASRFTAVAFDIGGVLIDWNPRHLYGKIFGPDEAAMERFLAEVCTPAWNARLDAGRSFADAVAELIREHPGQADAIAAYRSRWHEMLGEASGEMVEILRELRRGKVPVYALSNWSAEMYATTRSRFPFLDELDGALISGEVGVGKPEPVIFREFLDRFGLVAESTVFIDDSSANVAVARSFGIEAIEFESAGQVRRDLISRGFPLARHPPGS
jgi:2-haloacid dehalogenase